MDDGLLFVLSEPGGRVPDSEFHHWYDLEHAPARLTVPGINRGHRYRATDGIRPTWLALYPLCLNALDSPRYRALRTRTSYEQDIVVRLEILDRRVYRQTSATGHASERAPKHVLTVALSGRDIPALEAWYHEAHVPALGRLPGWQRTSCYQLLSGVAPRLLAVHELSGLVAHSADIYRRALGGLCQLGPRLAVTEKELRLFTYHNTVQSGTCHPASTPVPLGIMVSPLPRCVAARRING